MLLLDELYAAVLCPACFCGVVCYRLVASLANCPEVELVAAKADQCLDNGLSPLLRKRIVYLV